MTRLAWMTDIHLNFLGTAQIEIWLHDIRLQNYDAVLITGDIGEANSLQDYLIRIADYLGIPIYFVLGNHDYYGSSIENVRANIRRLHTDHTQLHWLPELGVVRLSDTIGLIGHGAWGDGGYGDFLSSELMLNDYQLIQDLCDLEPSQRLFKLRALGQSAGLYIERNLPIALQRFEHVYVALHVPPFQEACWYDGKTPADDDDYLPHFTCKAVGDVLLDIAGQNPSKKITIVCGHTHGSGEVMMRPNLQVITAGAEYGQPTVARIFGV